jgi:hypothetical protein
MLQLLNGVYGRVVDGQAAPNSNIKTGATPCTIDVLVPSMVQFYPAIAP